jgi:hypothetical protein
MRLQQTSENMAGGGMGGEDIDGQDPNAPGGVNKNGMGGQGVGAGGGMN